MNTELAYLRKPVPRATDLPKVSVVIVNFREPERTTRTLDALAASGYPDLEVVLIDNGSQSDESARWNYHCPHVVHLRSGANLGFAGACNLGIGAATGAHVLLLSNAALVEPDFLEPMVRLLERHARVGVVSPKVLARGKARIIEYAGAFAGGTVDGQITTIGQREPDLGRYDDVRDTELPHSACLLVRKTLLDELGELPKFYFLYFEERDFAVRAREMGFGVMYCGASTVRLGRGGSLEPPAVRVPTSPPTPDAATLHRRMVARLLFLLLRVYYSVRARRGGL